MKRRIVIGLAATAVAFAAAAPAEAGTNEARSCAHPTWVRSIQVNKYTTSCAFARAVARRITNGPSDGPLIVRSPVTGKRYRLHASRPDGRSYYLWGRNGIEMAIVFWTAGG